MVSKEQRVKDALKDRSFFMLGGHINPEELDAMRQGLLDLPSTALDDLRDSEFQILLAPKDKLVQLGLMDKKNNSLGHMRPLGNKKAKAIGANALIVVRADSPPEEIRITARHEIGHALDHMRTNYQGFASNQDSFKEAVNKYLYLKEKAEHTQIIFSGDRPFRDVHAPLYEDHQKFEELAAEMFNKYSALNTEHGPEHAESFMRREYPYAWQSAKENIFSQINESLAEQDLNASGLPIETDHDEGVRVIASQDWLSVEKPDTEFFEVNVHSWSPEKPNTKFLEVNVHSWPPEKRNILISELAAYNIGSEVVPSSVQNGEQVIRTHRDSYDLLSRLRKSALSMTKPEQVESDAQFIGALNWTNEDDETISINIGSLSNAKRFKLHDILERKNIAMTLVNTTQKVFISDAAGINRIKGAVGAHQAQLKADFSRNSPPTPEEDQAPSSIREKLRNTFGRIVPDFILPSEHSRTHDAFASSASGTPTSNERQATDKKPKRSNPAAEYTANS